MDDVPPLAHGPRAMCLCASIRRLSEQFNETDALPLASTLNRHLAAIRTLLSKSKSLSRDVQWQLTPNNQRTRKILSVTSLDVRPAQALYDRYRDDVAGFWSCTDATAAHAEIRRRIACVAILMRSELDTRTETWISSDIARAVPAQQGKTRVAELRFSGKKYIKIARKLGGIGSLLWLPLDVPSSTYERYLIMDDEEIFTHLQNLGSVAGNYDELVQKLLQSQVKDPSLYLPYHKLFPEFGDLLPSPEQVLLLLSALGGVNVPLELLKCVRTPQRRWTTDGELRDVLVTELEIPIQVQKLVSDDACLAEAESHPDVVRCVLEDGTVTLSLTPEAQRLFEMNSPSPQAWKMLSTLGLRLICFACPPCYEGKTSWSSSYKRAVWTLLQTLLERSISQKQLPPSLLTHLIEALLFFSERELFAIRIQAVERAKSLLQPSMPYYFHASVALFESNILRVSGKLDESNNLIQNFLSQDYPQNTGGSPIPNTTITRCDNALRGRLHISHIENMVRGYDRDVASCMYDWEGILPLSTFEIEVTRRLQGTAARYFQSVGDFATARASLQQHLWLNAAKPIRPNTRALIVAKLAEIHCELKECNDAITLLEPEIDSIPETGKSGRPFRRLSLALSEAHILLGRLDEAERILQDLAVVEPPEMDDVNDQYIHMRRLIDEARLVHERKKFDKALQLWGQVLERMDQLTIFKTRHKWTAVAVWLSIAHAQLQVGDDEAGGRSWALAADMSRVEKCDYAIPTLGTLWLQKIVGEVHREKGWPFRVMVTGGRPDMTWP